jgi:hypothetical protein
LQDSIAFGVPETHHPSIHVLYDQLNHYQGLVVKPRNIEYGDLISKVFDLPLEIRNEITSTFSFEYMKSFFGGYTLMCQFFQNYGLYKNHFEEGEDAMNRHFFRQLNL